MRRRLGEGPTQVSRARAVADMDIRIAGAHDSCCAKKEMGGVEETFGQA